MLKGKKVFLRALERNDLALLYSFNNDLEVELAGGGDPPMPQSLARLEAEYEQKIASGGRDGTDFAIEADGNFIGICALFNFDTVGRTCEFGITIGNKLFWGKGYGSEVIRLVVHYAFQHQNFRKVWLRVHGKNERARKAYEAVGFLEEGRLREHVYSDGQYDDLIFMGLLRTEWKHNK